MKFTAVGDALIQRRIQDGFEGLNELAPFIAKGDARFFNLETTLHREGECYASQFSGGTYVRTNPEMLDDLKKFGFNMTSFNNNHAMDFSYEGLLKTLDHLNKSGLVHSGVGRNLDEAAAPRYLETASGRVALISVNASFEPCMMAGTSGKRVPGRPGINGIRIVQRITVGKEDIDYIRKLAKKTNINAEDDADRTSGYLEPLPEDEAVLKNIRFCVGDEFGRQESVNHTDMRRVEKAIEEAKFQADYTLISIHCHKSDTVKEEIPPKFLVDFAHFCIDCGANAVIGHGTHLLRPIEVYKDSPIFYSLGDFILQLYSVEFGPEDFYVKKGLTSDETMYALLKKRSKDFKIGLMEDIRMNQSVIPYWEMDKGRLIKLELLPVQLVMKGNKSEIGLPRIAKRPDFMSHLAEISSPFGLKIEEGNGGVYCCKW